MSTPTPVAPYQSTQTAARDGFAPLLRAEFTKFRTVRGWVVGLLVAVAATVLLGVLGPLGSQISCEGQGGQSCGSHIPPLRPDGEPVADSSTFLHQGLAGDGAVTARVTALTGRYAPDGAAQAGPDGPLGLADGAEPWSKAGIMIKDGVASTSDYAAILVTGGNGVRWQTNYDTDVAGLPGAVSPQAPRWLRLTRTGDTVTGYDSADGVTWTEVGSARLPKIGAAAQIGLFTTSPDHVVVTQNFGGSSSQGGPSVATGVFDQVAAQGAGPAAGWTPTEVAPPSGPAAGPDGRTLGEKLGVVQDGGVFTLTGTGDIGPLPAGTDAGGPSRTVENGLVGGFAGLIAVVVVAALSVTSEYRRGLIRVTLAAAPRRGRVLAAKAVVVSGVSFAAGLVASAVSVPLVAALERQKGFYVFPASAATEARVIIGSAAIAGVAALFALGVGTAVRRSAGAVALVIVAIVLPYLLAVASVLPAGPAQWVARLTPAAAFSIEQTATPWHQVTASYTPADGYFPLGHWTGFGVLCLYAAAALGLAAWLLRRRDV